MEKVKIVYSPMTHLLRFKFKKVEGTFLKYSESYEENEIDSKKQIIVDKLIESILPQLKNFIFFKEETSWNKEKYIAGYIGVAFVTTLEDVGYKDRRLKIIIIKEKIKKFYITIIKRFLNKF